MMKPHPHSSDESDWLSFLLLNSWWIIPQDVFSLFAYEKISLEILTLLKYFNVSLKKCKWISCFAHAYFRLGHNIDWDKNWTISKSCTKHNGECLNLDFQRSCLTMHLPPLCIYLIDMFQWKTRAVTKRL